jgi:glycosyltransferase involved in cell wall biosynthesis
VPPGDPAALAGALTALAGDGARRAAMGAAARAVAVSRFDEREVLEGYRALFREVSSSRA